MRHAHELEPERAKLDRRPLGLDLAELGGAQQAVLVELRLDEAERQLRRPDLRNLHVAHQIGERPDVVLVRMREDDRPNRPGPVGEIGEVGEDEIDAEMLVTRKREAGIDDEAPRLVLEEGHVLSDLAEPTERDHAEGSGWHPLSVSAPDPCARPARDAGAPRESPFEVTLAAPFREYNETMGGGSFRVTRRIPLVLALLVLALPASALAHSVDTDQPSISPAAVPSVSPRAAQLAQAGQERNGAANAKLHVIVYGTDADAALASVHANKIMSLPLIDAVSGVIKASQLGALGLAPGVTFVNVDSPVRHTALDRSTATGTLATLYPR